MGDGRIHIQNIHNKQEANVSLFNADGSLNQSALNRIDAVFGFPAQETGEHVSLRLIFMLDYFSDLAAPGKVIRLSSGYRSPEYNIKLRKDGKIVAKTSSHIDGMALDFFIKGVRGKRLWEMIRKMNCCGVGHYGGNTVHLDAGRPRFWEAATSKVDTNESDYNRRIYLSTEFDRYRAGQTVRLFLSSVSDFGFGIQKKAALMNDSEGNSHLTDIEIQTKGPSDCIPINNRSASHSIYLTLPRDLKEVRYWIGLDFCQRPFEQMPQKILSNEIEILSSR